MGVELGLGLILGSFFFVWKGLAFHGIVYGMFSLVARHSHPPNQPGRHVTAKGWRWWMYMYWYVGCYLLVGFYWRPVLGSRPEFRLGFPFF